MKWAMKIGSNVLKGKHCFLPTPPPSNMLRLNYISDISKSEILDPFKATPIRCWFQQSRAFSMTYDEAIEKKKKNETVEVLIYFGDFGSKLKGLKVVSYSTSIITLLAQPYIYSSLMSMAIPATTAIYSILGFFTFVTPLLIHSVTKKYVTEINYNPSKDSYTSKTLTFFLKEKVVNFKLSDVKKVDSASLFNTFFIKGKPVIIFKEGFLDTEHYIKMMGYDKPIDLGLKSNVTTDKSVNSESQK